MIYRSWNAAKTLRALVSLLPFIVSSNRVMAQELPENGKRVLNEDEILQAALQPVGKLLFSHPTVELGEITQGSTIVAKFPYRIDGKGPVKILGIHEDCGCLSTSVKPGQYLALGEQGEISVSLDTKAFRGPVDKMIMIMTDESRSSRLQRLRIRGRIKPMVSLSPPLVRFDFAKGEESPEALVAVHRLAGQTLNIEKVEFNKDNLEVNVEPARDSWQVRIKWKGEVPVQPFQEMIRISAAPPYGNLQIPVLGHVGK